MKEGGKNWSQYIIYKDEQDVKLLIKHGIVLMCIV